MPIPAASYGEPLLIGIAGCGRLAEDGYLPALARLPGIRLGSIADPDPARLDACAAAAAAALGHEPARFSSAGEAAASGISALLVSAPAAQHEPAAAAAAAAGVPALVEKPFAPSLDGALRLAALEPAPRVGFNRRFLQGSAMPVPALTDGWLELDLELRYRRSAWGSFGGGDEALLDAGSHLVDLALWLTGSAPLAVRAAALDRERAGLVLEMRRARARISCATDLPHRERVVVRDRGGCVLARSAHGALRTRADLLQGRGHPLVRSLAAELTAFERELRSGGQAETPLAKAADGVRVMRVIEAARKSARLGGAEVTVSPEDAEAAA